MIIMCLPFCCRRLNVNVVLCVPSTFISQLKFLIIYALFGKSSLHLLMHLKRESFLFVSANIPFKLLGDYQRKNSYNLSMLYLNNHNLSAACFLLYSVGSTSDPVLHVRLFSEPSSSQQHLSPFSLFLPL